jgi:hypothetical protein
VEFKHSFGLGFESTVVFGGFGCQFSQGVFSSKVEAGLPSAEQFSE